MSEDTKTEAGASHTDEEPSNKETSEEKSGKRFAQWIAPAGAIGAALISALVSYAVTTIQVRAEKERSDLEARLEEAKIFRDLLDKVEEWEDPSFVVLALHKVFPDDQELIVTTAMLNPNFNTASALNAIGADENLGQYMDAIEGIFVNASSDKRQAFNEIYGEKFPEFALQLNYEVAIRTNGDKVAIGNLISAAANRPALIPLLRQRIEGDERLADNLGLKAQLARMLYQVDTSLMTSLLTEAETDDKVLEVLAPKYASDVRSLSSDVRDHLAEIGLKYMEKHAGAGGRQKEILNVLHLMWQLNPDRHLLPEQRLRLAELIEVFYRRYARLGRPFPPSLLALHRVTQDGRAEEIYFETITCLEAADAEDFYRAFPTSELAVLEWDDTRPFDTARILANERLSTTKRECGEW